MDGDECVGACVSKYRYALMVCGVMRLALYKGDTDSHRFIEWFLWYILDSESVLSSRVLYRDVALYLSDLTLTIPIDIIRFPVRFSTPRK